MSRLDLSGMAAALRSMEKALRLMSSSAFEAANDDLRDLMRAGVVQNFEFCFEMASRMLKRALEGGSESIDGALWRTLVRHAAERGLLDDPEHWLHYRTLRNITSHTYDRAKADRVLDGAAPFLADSLDLLQRLDSADHG